MGQKLSVQADAHFRGITDDGWGGVRNVMSPAACRLRRAISPAFAAASLSKTATRSLFM
jgi:hypothetical protein